MSYITRVSRLRFALKDTFQTEYQNVSTFQRLAEIVSPDDRRGVFEGPAESIAPFTFSKKAELGVRGTQLEALSPSGSLPARKSVDFQPRYWATSRAVTGLSARVAIGDVQQQRTPGLEAVAVDLGAFRGEQMERDGIARERIDGDQVVIVTGAGGELTFHRDARILPRTTSVRALESLR